MCNKLIIKFPIHALELEKILRVHCEHHGVWDDCIVYSDVQDDNIIEKDHEQNENVDVIK